jgi:hypothetical protein
VHKNGLTFINIYVALVDKWSYITGNAICVWHDSDTVRATEPEHPPPQKKKTTTKEMKKREERTDYCKSAIGSLINLLVIQIYFATQSAVL